MDRRFFSQSMLSAFGAGLLSLMGMVPGAAYLLGPAFQKREASEEWIDLGPVDQLTPDVHTERIITVTVQDGWQTKAQKQGVFILFKNSEPEVLSSICPHLSCSLYFDDNSHQFRCPCHLSFFDLKGELVSGPAPRGMDPLPCKVENGNLYCRWAAYKSGVARRVEV